MFLKQISNIRKIIANLIKKKVYVFGDSHSEIFVHLNSRKYNKRYYFDVCLVGGATAQGLRNPNSKTKALEIFKSKIETIQDKSQRLVFSLGEVDTGFVIWYRAEKYHDDVMNQLQTSLHTYFDFLNELKHIGFSKIAVLSAPPPTIEDDQDWGEVANLRKDIKANKKARTELNTLYNKQLNDFCHNNGIYFIDCDPVLLDQKTGLINSYFLNKDSTNHHLDIDKFSGVVYQILNKIFK